MSNGVTKSNSRNMSSMRQRLNRSRTQPGLPVNPQHDRKTASDGDTNRRDEYRQDDRSEHQKVLDGGSAAWNEVDLIHQHARTARIILADEPTAALDSKRAGIVMDLLRKLAVEHDAAIIAVTHDEKIFDASIAYSTCATAVWPMPRLGNIMTNRPAWYRPKPVAMNRRRLIVRTGERCDHPAPCPARFAFARRLSVETHPVPAAPGAKPDCRTAIASQPLQD
jgi:hypothetical protein